MNREALNLPVGMMMGAWIMAFIDAEDLTRAAAGVTIGSAILVIIPILRALREKA